MHYIVYMIVLRISILDRLVLGVGTMDPNAGVNREHQWGIFTQCIEPQFPQPKMDLQLFEIKEFCQGHKVSFGDLWPALCQQFRRACIRSASHQDLQSNRGQALLTAWTTIASRLTDYQLDPLLVNCCLY